MVSAIWDEYLLEMTFRDRLCGSVPLARKLVRTWLESRKPERKPEGARDLEELEQEVLETLPDDEVSAEEMQELVTLGFQRDEQGLFVRSGYLRAHLKDCAQQCRQLATRLFPGLRSRRGAAPMLRAMVANKVYPREDRLYLLRRLDSGREVTITEHDGEYDQPVHVLTPVGPRSALKTIRYVTRPLIRAHLLVLADRSLSYQVLRTLLEYGSVHGFGGERSLGEGRYEFRLVLLESAWQQAKDAGAEEAAGEPGQEEPPARRRRRAG